MSEDKDGFTQASDESKVKFREALKKKTQSRGIRANKVTGNSKIHGTQRGGEAPKLFRRKSASN